MIRIRDIFRPQIISYSEIQRAYVSDGKANYYVIWPQRNVSWTERGIECTKKSLAEDGHPISIMRKAATTSSAHTGKLVGHNPPPAVVGQASVEDLLIGNVRIVIRLRPRLLGHVCCRPPATSEERFLTSLSTVVMRSGDHCGIQDALSEDITLFVGGENVSLTRSVNLYLYLSASKPLDLNASAGEREELREHRFPVK